MKKKSTFTPEKKRETMESIINFIADEFKEDIKHFKTINCTGLLMRSVLYDTIKIVNERFTDKNTGLIVTEELSATKELINLNQKGGKRMNKLQVIDQRNLLGKNFKVYGDFENPLFLARDVAEWIDYQKTSEGYYNTSKMLNTVDEDEKVTIPNKDSGGSKLFLTEDGLYEVLMQSRKPIAKKFKKEVKKILKSIRMNGIYVAQAKAHEKMFNAMKVEMTGFVDEIVSDKINKIEAKCSEYYRPVSKEKQNVVNYIKKRLGIDKANEEYELVKQRVLIKLNAEKWEDIPVETLVNSLNVIDESIRVIKADRIDNQITFFEAACAK